MILTLVLVNPVFAKAGDELTGERIDFIAHYQEYPADTAFYMNNGWKVPQDTLQEQGFTPGMLGFKLEVDNELRRSG